MSSEGKPSEWGEDLEGRRLADAAQRKPTSSEGKRWNVGSAPPQTGQGARFWITGPEPPPSQVADASEVERLREAGNELSHLLLTIPAVTTVEFQREVEQARRRWVALHPDKKEDT